MLLCSLIDTFGSITSVSFMTRDFFPSRHQDLPNKPKISFEPPESGVAKPRPACTRRIAHQRKELCNKSFNIFMIKYEAERRGPWVYASDAEMRVFIRVPEVARA